MLRVLQSWTPLPFVLRESPSFVCVSCTHHLRAANPQPYLPRRSFSASASFQLSQEPHRLTGRSRDRPRRPRATHNAPNSRDAQSALAKMSVEYDDADTERLHRPHWQIDKEAMKKKLNGEKWNPTRKRLSPDTMAGIRALHQQYPEQATVDVLAKHFGVWSEAIRRVLKSKWKPTPEEEEKQRERWDKRGKEVWERLSEKGYKPPAKWRSMGVGRTVSGEGVPRWKRSEWHRRNHPEGTRSTNTPMREDSRRNTERENFKSLREDERQRGRDEWWKKNIDPILRIRTTSDRTGHGT